VGDNPLDLSILVRGGKDTTVNSLSSGERREKSPTSYYTEVSATVRLKCTLLNLYLE